MRFKILPELSALGINKATSPILPKVIDAIKSLRESEGSSGYPLVVDFGCGQLRNLKELLKYFPHLYLVDTEYQLTKKHNFNGQMLTIREFIEMNHALKSISVLTSQEFADSPISADIIFSINVLDVTPPRVRHEILNIVSRKLSGYGLFAAIVPTNDHRTLELCKRSRRYFDGYIFPNHGAFTYYRNWSRRDLAKLYKKHNLEVIHDMSSYRYACAICKLLQ
jgi:hypothetical protein